MYRATVFVCFLFIALTSYIAQAMTDDQKAKIHEHFMTIGAECMKDNPITEDDMKNLQSKQVPTGENVPCFLACVMKNVGVMDDQGMLQKETALELAKKVFDDPEELKNIEDYLHSCAPINKESVSDGAKGCERAVLGLKCMMANAAKFGFDL
ncbi:general odorant-binding protein 28a-like [Hyposmocoma kahamanoa]|uniref:general odorant-binding protein 28a-like n=1 Tax=Hyposmocoma kahamanoa TaxID=1477025 RepID=UPI000E6D8C3B|nr:general odorant-binding protein 28a-like [Hyposmocoma kahamanoa]